jgi:hypothetical protein
MDDFKPVDDTPAVADPQHVTRQEGLLKDQVSWHDDAFAPMTAEELAEFDD